MPYRTRDRQVAASTIRMLASHLFLETICVSYTPGCATYSFWGHMPKMGMVVPLQVVCLLLLSLTLSFYGRRKRRGVLTPLPSSLSSPPSTRQISHAQHRKSSLLLLLQVFFFKSSSSSSLLLLQVYFVFFFFHFVLTINIIKRTSAVCVGGVGGGRGLTRGHSWRWCVGS